MTEKVTKNVTIAAEEAGLRLDRVLAAHIATMSRSRLKALILAGHVKIAERTIRDPAASVNSGDTVTVTLPPPEKATPEGEAIPLNIVYEDDEIIVIDKPRGLVVHPAAGHTSARHRSPSRQGHNRPDGGGQDRQGSPRALKAVR
jgi:23S rRNA pseudouridine1911/1915/1917 synthase